MIDANNTIKMPKKGEKMKPETRKKLSNVLREMVSLGLRVPPSKKGKKNSEATRKKISDGNKGKKRSEATRKKITDANKKRWQEMSEETKKKAKKSMSDAQRKRWQESWSMPEQEGREERVKILCGIDKRKEKATIEAIENAYVDRLKALEGTPKDPLVLMQNATQKKLQNMKCQHMNLATYIKEFSSQTQNHTEERNVEALEHWFSRILTFVGPCGTSCNGVALQVYPGQDALSYERLVEEFSEHLSEGQLANYKGKAQLIKRLEPGGVANLKPVSSCENQVECTIASKGRVWLGFSFRSKDSERLSTVVFGFKSSKKGASSSDNFLYSAGELLFLQNLVFGPAGVDKVFRYNRMMCLLMKVLPSPPPLPVKGLEEKDLPISIVLAGEKRQVNKSVRKFGRHIMYEETIYKDEALVAAAKRHLRFELA